MWRLLRLKKVTDFFETQKKEQLSLLLKSYVMLLSLA